MRLILEVVTLRLPADAVGTVVCAWVRHRTLGPRTSRTAWQSLNLLTLTPSHFCRFGLRMGQKSG